jgi:hypothetical protein
VKVTRENLFTFDNVFAVGPEGVGPGRHTVTVSRAGGGEIQTAVRAAFLNTGEDLRGAGKELRVQRRYFRLEPLPFEPGHTGPPRFRRIPLESGAAVAVGNLLEVDLRLFSEHTHEYTAFEDLRPAGCEPVDVRSGYRYGQLCTNLELREDRTTFFLPRLYAGESGITYRLRAEVPGRYHVMPARGFAMYRPEVQATSDEFRLTIRDPD